MSCPLYIFKAYMDKVIRLVNKELSYLEGAIIAYAGDPTFWSLEDWMLSRLVESFARNLREAWSRMNVEKAMIVNHTSDAVKKKKPLKLIPAMQ